MKRNIIRSSIQEVFHQKENKMKKGFLKRKTKRKKDKSQDLGQRVGVQKRKIIAKEGKIEIILIFKERCVEEDLKA